MTNNNKKPTHSVTQNTTTIKLDSHTFNCSCCSDSQTLHNVVYVCVNSGYFFEYTEKEDEDIKDDVPPERGQNVVLITADRKESDFWLSRASKAAKEWEKNKPRGLKHGTKEFDKFIEECYNIYGFFPFHNHPEVLAMPLQGTGEK